MQDPLGALPAALQMEVLRHVPWSARAACLAFRAQFDAACTTLTLVPQPDEGMAALQYQISAQESLPEGQERRVFPSFIHERASSAPRPLPQADLQSLLGRLPQLQDLKCHNSVSAEFMAITSLRSLDLTQSSVIVDICL